MNTRVAFAIVTLVFAIPAFLLAQVIWPSPAGAPQPPAGLLPLFILYGAIEAIAFGAGVAFLVFGYRWVRAVGGAGRLTWLTYLSIAFVLMQWWPHDNMHRVAGTDFGALLRLEYGFHATIILASTIIAIFFARALPRRATA